MDEFREYLRSAEINEMSPNYSPDKTVLNEYIWISTKQASHGTRIKVYDKPNGKNFSVWISDNPKIVAGECFVNAKELKRIFAFILKYKDDLIAYWNSELTTDELEHNLFD